ncbi:MAG: GNAT family N-acetyltransferase [Spirochaetaceae bacterium]|nr:MAG: GNAT family N-acetyltransferase [Spirochaetaceae bacterium]
MPWFAARTPLALSRVEEFVRSNEWSCASVGAQLRQRTPLDMLKRHTHFEYFTLDGQQGPVLAINMENSFGFRYPVLSETAISAGAAMELGGRSPTSGRRSMTVMGREQAVCGVEASVRLTFGREPKYRVEYYLMTRQAGSVVEGRSRVAEQCRFLRADARHTDRLLAMQIAYEEEEVVVDGRRVDPQATRFHLRDDLREQLVYFATHDGRAVAKAGTNARGFTYDQIGGVYTEPALRGHGISTALMQVLLNSITEYKKNAVLFVKKPNKSAIAVYDRLGFETRDSFVISYYQ